MRRGQLILISGGARSGKSAFAEQLARDLDSRVAYIATAQALDNEMQDRIKQHQQVRPASWKTFEEPFEPGEVILKNSGDYKTWLLDCVTLYVSNLLFTKVKSVNDEHFIANDIQDYILCRIDNLIKTIDDTKITMLAVTNEVGWGIVPADPLSRAYRDIVGRVNQRLAKKAQEVYLVALSMPIRLKPSSPIIYNRQERF